MKRSAVIAIIVVVAVAVAAGAYYLYHGNGYQTPSSSTSTSANDSNLPDVNNAVLITKTDSKLGKYLATPDGLPLYTYASDSEGVSNCTGGCLSNWPAYQATGDTSNLPAGVSVITRSDNGQKQYAFNGGPLYTFSSDSNGKVTGDGVASFHVAKPATPVSTQSSTTPSPSASAVPTATPNTSSSSGSPY